ncbi:MAG: biotin/lipoyl-containing protein, partial [Dehalococcoidia bacterium]
MAIEVTMPQMGADMAEGVVVRWLKQVGDPVERGDILAEIETDKA